MANIPIWRLRPLSRIGMGKFGGHIEIDFKGVRTKMQKLAKFATGRQAKNFRDAWVQQCLTLIGDEMAETWRKQPGWKPNTKEWAMKKINMKVAGHNVITGKVGQFSGKLNTIVIKGGQTYLQAGGFMSQSKGTRGTNSTGFNIIATNVEEKLRAAQAPHKGGGRPGGSKYPVYFNREHRFVPTVNEIKKIGSRAFADTLRKKHANEAWARKIKNKALLKGTGL